MLGIAGRGCASLLPDKPFEAFFLSSANFKDYELRGVAVKTSLDSPFS
jgi:hypothetical protein